MPPSQDRMSRDWDEQGRDKQDWDARDWDAVVVGAGLGGLTAAAYLATNGLRTLVLEQWSVAGGFSHVFRRRGFEFDVGVHYVGDCGPDGTIPTILRGVGLEGRVEFLPMDPDGFDTLVFPGLTFRVPRGWDRYLDALVEAFPGEERGLRECIRVLRRVALECERAGMPETRAQAAAFVLRCPTAVHWSARPLSELLDSCGLTPAARAVICGQSGDYGAPPDVVPAAMHAALLHHFLKSGTYFPRGGGQVLAANLIDVITAHGGQVRTGVRADRILVSGGAVTGVRLRSGEVLSAPVVVSNAAIPRTYLELVGSEHLPARTLRKVGSYRMAPPFFIVYLGLDHDLATRMPNTNYWLHQDTEPGSFYRGVHPGRAGTPTPVGGLFISSATVKDPHSPHLAPPGHSTLQLMAFVPAHHSFWHLSTGPAAGERYRRNAGYRAVKERISQDMVRMATQVLPDLREHIVWEEAATPVTQERYTLATGGSCLGLEVSTGQFGLHRPRATTPVRGLYLTGAGTRSGPGVVGATTSGVIAAGAVLGRNLLAEVRGGRVFADPALLGPRDEDRDALKASRNLRPASGPAARADTLSN
ncbi:NAD(P)/FAD-dependent oxidoreductase [Saccharopolyspora erythraea]|uniref:phytoene desaturase family protein n=1 Tax=Saccharopolyspora erythraea TaxID=1836 RepID=UPI001BADDF59|nr:NAD(P)/FAD-dependent oxidoreductase [Saccharopolyspora erythraea]QUH03452.1 NAD(P)/FAD-dependent oxidoreductase [Saccharopolyspora erythraea]